MRVRVAGRTCWAPAPAASRMRRDDDAVGRVSREIPRGARARFLEAAGVDADDFGAGCRAPAAAPRDWFRLRADDPRLRPEPRVVAGRRVEGLDSRLRDEPVVVTGRRADVGGWTARLWGRRACCPWLGGRRGVCRVGRAGRVVAARAVDAAAGGAAAAAGVVAGVGRADGAAGDRPGLLRALGARGVRLAVVRDVGVRLAGVWDGGVRLGVFRRGEAHDEAGRESRDACTNSCVTRSPPSKSRSSPGTSRAAAVGSLVGVGTATTGGGGVA